MKRWLPVAAGLVVASCSTVGLVATTTTNPPEPDIVAGNDLAVALQCAGAQEAALFDNLAGDPFPFADTDSAVHDLIANEGRNRADWLQLEQQAVILGNGGARVTLADDADLVRLVVRLDRSDGRWRVAGYESCAPDG